MWKLRKQAWWATGTEKASRDEWDDRTHHRRQMAALFLGASQTLEGRVIFCFAALDSGTLLSVLHLYTWASFNGFLFLGNPVSSDWKIHSWFFFHGLARVAERVSELSLTLHQPCSWKACDGHFALVRPCLRPTKFLIFMSFPLVHRFSQLR